MALSGSPGGPWRPAGADPARDQPHRSKLQTPNAPPVPVAPMAATRRGQGGGERGVECLQPRSPAHQEAKREELEGVPTSELPGTAGPGLEVHRRPAARAGLEGALGGRWRSAACRRRDSLEPPAGDWRSVGDEERRASVPCPELLPTPPAVLVFCYRI